MQSQIWETFVGAHITPDNDPDSFTAVGNEIGLCKMHHAAYDREFLGNDTDFAVQVRADILNISDGPMLQYGLQKIHERELPLPDLEINWPDKVRLD
jgi:putative restriction endonuclease